MDAWGVLTDKSTISVGDAWEHLQAQGGGGGGTASYIVLADGVHIEMSANDVEITVDQQPVEVTIDPQELTVTVDQSPMEVEV